MTTKRTTKKKTAKKAAKKTAKKVAKKAAKKVAKKKTSKRATKKAGLFDEDETEEVAASGAEAVEDAGDRPGAQGPDTLEADARTGSDEDAANDDSGSGPDAQGFDPADEEAAEALPEVELMPNRREPATREELLADFDDEYLSIKSLFEFCFVPQGRLAFLRDLAVEEDWGDNGTVLLKYLAVNVRLAIEQGAYVWNGDQLVMSVGSLTTPAGTPIYLGLVRNQDPDQNPWVMNWVGERPRSAELPAPPRLPQWPNPLAREIVVAADLSDPERRVKVPAIGGISAVAQSCAITGAVHWAMRRGLAVRQLHGASMGWFVPLFFGQRDDATDVPDAAAPVMCVGSRLVVRAVLEPQVCYPASRALVERWDQLPTWLVESWDASREGDDD